MSKRNLPAVIPRERNAAQKFADLARCADLFKGDKIFVAGVDPVSPTIESVPTFSEIINDRWVHKMEATLSNYWKERIEPDAVIYFHSTFGKLID